MSSNVPSDEKMQMTGNVLSWLVGSAIAGTLIFVLALILDNASPGTQQALGPLARFLSGIAAPVLLVALAAEALAFVLLVVGLVRWRSGILRSPRWLLSAVGIVMVVVALGGVTLIAIIIALESP
jgi:hypothetical protein